jgi:hypothetical protein
MHSTRQFHKPIRQIDTMTHEKPLVATTPGKPGIAIQSSTPLYSQKQHDHHAEEKVIYTEINITQS